MNFSDLARTFGLKDNDAYGKDNKNQVVNQFLVNNGINIDRFNYHKKMDYDQFHIRRKKLKLKNTGGNVSVPTDPCLDDIKRNLHRDILDGKYEMGKLIEINVIFLSYSDFHYNMFFQFKFSIRYILMGFSFYIYYFFVSSD